MTNEPETMATAVYGGCVLPHPETDPMGFLQAAFGQATIGNPACIAVVMRGVGARGKSTLLRMLAENSDGSIRPVSPELYCRFGKADVDKSHMWNVAAGATVTIADETPDGTGVSLDVDAILKATYGAPVECRAMGEPLSQKSVHNMPVIVTELDLPNHEPKTRRIAVVTMPNTYEGDTMKAYPNTNDVLDADSVDGWLEAGLALYNRLNPGVGEQVA